MQPVTRRLQVLAAAAIALTLSLFFLFASNLGRTTLSRRPGAETDTPTAYKIDLEFNAWQHLQLPTTFTYRRVCIEAQQSADQNRQTLVKLGELLPSHDDAVEITLPRSFSHSSAVDALLPSCQANMIVEVPDFDTLLKRDTSALMLGVATTLERIESSLPAFARWLPNTGTTLLVLLVDQPRLQSIRDELRRIQRQYQDLGMQIVFQPYRGSVARDSEGLKNFALAEALDSHRRDDTQWFGVIDDDTFFLSLARVVEALSQLDHEQPLYVGALTEGHTRLSNEGFKAWGGAGFFISPPLMRTLAQNSLHCRKALKQQFGDLLWRDCILETTSPTVGLTELPGLNQLDIWGDVSGWYEAPHASILSVHHWKSWHFFPIPNAHEVSDVAGADTFLQRYLLENNTVLTNGFSIVEYPRGLPNLDLAELTFVEDVRVYRTPGKLEFHHSLGRTRPAMDTERAKLSWTFEMGVTSDGTVRQFYVRRTNNGNEVSVIELDWRRGPRTHGHNFFG